MKFASVLFRSCTVSTDAEMKRNKGSNKVSYCSGAGIRLVDYLFIYLLTGLFKSPYFFQLGLLKTSVVEGKYNSLNKPRAVFSFFILVCGWIIIVNVFWI